MALDPGLVGEVAQGSVMSAPEHFASRIFPDAPDVFSTMALGSLVESTAAAWLQRYLDPAELSVGAQLVINHTAATPAGLEVVVDVRVVAIDGRRVDFEWTAQDAQEAVGNGTHQRFVLDRERFMSRLAAKAR